ncbi:hypothetical protein IID23_02410 [Patescibacteria group bacterium]|nr:hypothetical protein [Patescibacteria group bacterium]
MMSVRKSRSAKAIFPSKGGDQPTSSEENGEGITFDEESIRVMQALLLEEHTNMASVCRALWPDEFDEIVLTIGKLRKRIVNIRERSLNVIEMVWQNPELDDLLPTAGRELLQNLRERFETFTEVKKHAFRWRPGQGSGGWGNHQPFSRIPQRTKPEVVGTVLNTKPDTNPQAVSLKADLHAVVLKTVLLSGILSKYRLASLLGTSVARIEITLNEALEMFRKAKGMSPKELTKAHDIEFAAAVRQVLDKYPDETLAEMISRLDPTDSPAKIHPAVFKSV